VARGERAQLQHVERALDAMLIELAPSARRAGRDILQHAPVRKEQHVLRHISDVPLRGREIDLARAVEQRCARDGDATGARRAPAGDELEQRRLARARRPEHRERGRVALELDGEVEVRQRELDGDLDAAHAFFCSSQDIVERTPAYWSTSVRGQR
jgi:hypothetical protein